MNKQTAKLNYLRMTPRKVRAVADVIKGLSANEAEAQLMMQSRRAAKPLLKLLRSAVADAKNNKHISADNLFIESLRVDQGPMLKRFLPRARGMATPIQRKMSHVTLVLTEKEGVTPKFKIIVPKKVKLPPGETSPRKREKPKAETMRVEPKKPGFWKRLFSPKSRAAK